MATQTTNYNLSKPEATDPFSQFRQSYNDNLDIIDANLGGGGGGGGHTIIDPNGSDMAQRAGLQFTGSCSVTDDAVNDKTVVNISGGGGSVNYSTSEQVIGTYLGKPLYQKTWNNLLVAITGNVWANTGISATDIETIVDGTMQDDNLQKIGGTIGFMSSHTYIGVNPQLGNRNLTALTILYTKISD